MNLLKITLLAGVLALLTGCETSQDSTISPEKQAADQERMQQEMRIQ